MTWTRTLMSMSVVAALLGCKDDTVLAPTPRLAPSAPSFAEVPKNPPPTILTTQLPEAQVGQPYHYQISASGRNLPLSFAITGGTLPAGLTLDPKTGIISGTPTTKGFSGNIVVTVTDSKGQTTDSRKLSLNVDDPHWGLYILGQNGPAPAAGATSGEKPVTMTLSITYTKNGVSVTKTVTITVPAKSNPDAILNALLPAVQAALAADFDVTLITGAASPRIDLVAKPGVLLGANKPTLTVGQMNPAYVVAIGKLRLSAALANVR